MSHIKINTQIEILDNLGHKQVHDFKNTLNSVAEYVVKEFVLAANGTIVIWDADATGETITTFDRAIIYADGIVDLELTINDGGGTGVEEFNSIRIIKGVPLILGADDAYDTHGTDALASAATPDEVIDAIRVDEPAGSARKVTLILAKIAD